MGAGGRIRYDRFVRIVRVCIVAAALFSLVTGCSSDSVTSTLDCINPFDLLDAAVGGYESVLGAVALPSSDIQLQLAPTVGDDTGMMRSVNHVSTELIRPQARHREVVQGMCM
jgi:hypothetical protein